MTFLLLTGNSFFIDDHDDIHDGRCTCQILKMIHLDRMQHMGLCMVLVLVHTSIDHDTVAENNDVEHTVQVDCTLDVLVAETCIMAGGWYITGAG